MSAMRERWAERNCFIFHVQGHQNDVHARVTELPWIELYILKSILQWNCPYKRLTFCKTKNISQMIKILPQKPRLYISVQCQIPISDLDSA